MGFREKTGHHHDLHGKIGMEILWKFRCRFSTDPLNFPPRSAKGHAHARRLGRQVLWQDAHEDAVLVARLHGRHNWLQGDLSQLEIAGINQKRIADLCI